MPLTLLDAYPLHAVTPPGSHGTLVLEVEHDGEPREGTLTVRLCDAAVEVRSVSTPVRLERGLCELQAAVDLPVSGPTGYEVLFELLVGDERLGAATAILAIDHWRQAPRYGFLSEFGPGEAAPERVRELAKFHLSVVQFYDWMYRHYRFLPPEDEFEDAMKRRLSLATVAARVRACQDKGMAALAYGAVYGAEPEFTRERPDWVLKDASGQDLSLIDLFTINDLREGAPWREHILQEFETAVTEVGFDGIHMDQYGFPKWSYDAAGQPVDLAASFPGLVDEAARRLAARREGAAVLFNNVNAWPLEAVAPSNQAAVYIEVWPPHERYQDLVDLIRRARDLSGKQAILAAYLEPFREGGPGAEASALLATAVIGAAGGFHLLLGEGDRVLRDPYYPNHGRLEAAFVPRLRRYYDHTAAFHRHLFGEDLQEVSGSFTTGINGEIALEGAPASVRPQAGTVWLTIRQVGRRFVINLVNLVAVGDDRWNVHKEMPTALDGLVLRFSSFARVQRVAWASPDGIGAALALTGRDEDGGTTSYALPRLDVWATLVVDLG